MVGTFPAELHRVAREAGVGVRHPAHADGVGVAPRQQRRPRRRAHRRDVEVRVAEALRREPVEMRRLDLGAVAPEIGEAEVVGEHDDDVRRALGRRGARRPPRLRGRDGAADRALESRVGAGVQRGASRRPQVIRRHVRLPPLRRARAGRVRLAEAAEAPHRLQVAFVDLVHELVERHLAAVAMDAVGAPRPPRPIAASRGAPRVARRTPTAGPGTDRGGSCAHRARGARAAPAAARRSAHRSPAPRAGPRPRNPAGSRRSRGSTSPRAARSPAAGGASGVRRQCPRSVAGPRARPRAGP